MRVVHVTTGLNQDGAQSVLYRLVSVPSPGVEHVVVSMMDEGAYGKRMVTAGIPVHALDMPRGRLTAGGIARLYKLLRSLKPDVVQTWMYHADLVGGVVARLAGCSHVVWGVRHSDHDGSKTSWSTRLAAKLSAMVSGMVPAAIASCSERAASIHQDLGYSKAKFHVVPNGYDLARFAPGSRASDALRLKWGITPDAGLVGCVARWHPQKDHANLLKALEALAGKHPKLRCVLVGDGMAPENAELMALISMNGLTDRIILAGPMDDIPAVMNTLDLHVLASAYGEAFPNVVAEAMACGTPCVVTDVGDAALIVGDTGLAVPPKDSEALARAIESLLAEHESEPERWRERKDACRARIVENFSLERMVNAYRALWAGVAGGRAEAANPQTHGAGKAK